MIVGEMPGKNHAYNVVARACMPRERLTVSQWADKHRWVSSKQSGEYGPWRTSRNPMLREIMDSLSDSSNVSEVVVMKSSQVGLTEATVNWTGYVMDYAPGPMMIFMPTLSLRDEWRLQKLNPLLSETEVISNILGGLKTRDAANSKETIDFPGGILFLSGGNSSNSYRQKSARYLVMDDLDGFPAEIGKAGDPVELARGRVKAQARSKILFISTPTLKNVSLIEREYQASDQRRYHVPCPDCGEFQYLKWKNVMWDKGLNQVWYTCEHCGSAIHEYQKPQMLRDGEWIADRPDIKRRGYHISALNAPIGLGPSWHDLAEDFLHRKSDPTRLQVFINEQLGETWEDQTDRINENHLTKRCEDISARQIPPGCLAITCGVDTQDEWLAIQLLGWGAPLEPHDYPRLWVLDYFELTGDTSSQTIWGELQDFLHTPLINAYGKKITIKAAGVDSRGHRSAEVRQFVMREQLRIPVYALQGSTARLNRAIAASPSTPDKNNRGKVLKDGYGLWNVGTEYCKDFIYGRLTADISRSPEDSFLRFPKELPDHYFNGLLSEKYDPKTRRYVQRIGAKYKRNEPLDTIVYSWVVGQHREVNIGKTRRGKPDPKYWERLAAVLERPDEEMSETIQSETTQPETLKIKKQKKVKATKQSGFGNPDWNL